MIEIQPVAKVDAAIEVPGSKSLTQRALIAAALAQGESKLVGPLESEDTAYSAQALAQMGVFIEKRQRLANSRQWRFNKTLHRTDFSRE